MLKLENVRKIYTTKAGDTAALDGINLEFPESGLVFITGKSGSGKTTLLNLIGGLDGLTEGEIYIDGKKFSDFSPKEYDSYRNTFIGFIFQEYNLLPEYTVEKNISMANELQGKNISKQEINELLDVVGIGDLGNRLPSELSGGQKQRVAIARALVKNPHIIMGDEPTGALDSVTGIQVIETLKNLSKNKLVVIVSHDLELAEKYADRIIRLKDGEVIEDVLLSDEEIKGNVLDGNPISVRAGATLENNETELVLKAIREKRKINVTDKMIAREKRPTPKYNGGNQEDGSKVKLINSKMKFKSAAGFGLKSLRVKPLRLAFTILLSVIAFAVFGIFDTVASYSEARIIRNTLRNSDFVSVAATAKYFIDEDHSYNIKATQSQIDNINSNTGYSFKGVSEIVDKYSNINGSTIISALSNRTGDVQKGKNYYNFNISGAVEFKPEELANYGYKVLYGEYPTLDKTVSVTDQQARKVGISTYTAESIVKYMNKGEYGFSFEGKTIESIEDFIGCTLKLGSNTETGYYQKTGYEIVCIIDIGNIPAKYDSLKTKTAKECTAVELRDFNAFISSGAYNSLFVAEGFTEHFRNNSPVVYTGFSTSDDKLRFSYSSTIGTKNETLNASSIAYKDNEVSMDNVLMFDLSHETKDKLELKNGDIIVNYTYLSGFLLNEAGIYLPNDQAIRANYDQVRDNFFNSTSNVQEKRTTFKALVNFLNSENFYKSKPNSAGLAGLKAYITIDYKDKTIQDQSLSFNVAGVYFDITNETLPTYPLILNANDMKTLNICNEQGTYSRMIAPKSFFGSTKVANLMTLESGLAIRWYNNETFEFISENEQTVTQFFQLFLYIAIVLALFSVFMLFNYISTSVLSKRQAIGILRALGSNVKDISTMFIVESIAIALINAFFACVVTAVGCIFVNQYIMQVMKITINFAVFDIRQVLIITLASILTAIVSSIMPIVKICKEKPVDLIRKV